MNEQYLFRGFYEDQNGTKKIIVNGKDYVGEWADGNVVEHHNGDLYIYYTEYLSFKVIPETVGQFTGLPDKNGVKIFEKDRLGRNGTCAEVIFQNGTFISVWEEEEIGYVQHEDTLYDDLFLQKCEVIGTIFDEVM